MRLKDKPPQSDCDQPLPARPNTACKPREHAAATRVPARRAWTAATPSLYRMSRGWRDVRAPSRLHVPVAGWGATTSASRPSRPSGRSRPPAAASSCTDSSSTSSCTGRRAAYHLVQHDRGCFCAPAVSARYPLDSSLTMLGRGRRQARGLSMHSGVLICVRVLYGYSTRI